MVNKFQRVMMRVLLGFSLLGGTPPWLFHAEGGGLGQALLGRVLKGAARGPAAKGVKPSWTEIHARDAARDAVTPAKPLMAPRTVHRYTTEARAAREVQQGIKPGTHMTPNAPAGRPLTPGHAQQRYGLETKPEVRMTIDLPKGLPVRPNKALAGTAGRGELTSPQALPPQAIRRVTKLPE